MLPAKGKPCKPGKEPAPKTGLDQEGAQENVPFTFKITEDDIKTLPLSVEAAIPIMEEAFRLAGEGSTVGPDLTGMGRRFGSGSGKAAQHHQQLLGTDSAVQ